MDVYGIVMKMSQVMSEFNKLKTSGSDLATILQHIRENEFFSTFCNASKRSVTIADYCTYYMLYPYMVYFSLFSCHPGNIITFQWERPLSELLHANAEFEEHPIECLRSSDSSAQTKETELENTRSSIVESSSPAATPAAAAPLTPEECLSQLDIRVGRLVKVWNHPDSDKLLCEQVDVGEGVPRSIGSGIRAFHSAEEIQGRLVCVMCNLKPKKLAGYPSNGMLLCASVKDHSKGALIDPPEGSEVGERVCFAGISGNAAAPSQVHKKKMLETVLPVCVSCGLGT